MQRVIFAARNTFFTILITLRYVYYVPTINCNKYSSRFGVLQLADREIFPNYAYVNFLLTIVVTLAIVRILCFIVNTVSAINNLVAFSLMYKR